MDSLQKWHAHVADVKTLFTHWEERRLASIPMRKKDREILAICLFTLCLENNESKRFLIGFQQRGLPAKPSLIRDLFEDGFGEIENCDVILIPDLGPDGPDERDIHRCQLVGYLNRGTLGTTEDLIEFLEEKKLRVPPDNDLRLIIHLEQPTAFDWVKLSIHFQMRRPKCPYSQVFLLADTGVPSSPRWSCRQLYPLMLPLRDMDLETARVILADKNVVYRRTDSRKETLTGP
jgi:hypothetical protein